MNQKSEYEFVVTQGKRGIFELMLASVFFGAFILVLLRALYYLAIEPSADLFVENLGDAFRSMGVIPLGLYFATVKSILIDTDKDLLISRYDVGPISWDRKSSVTHLEYVSVFLDQKGNYQVNLWYKGNKHYKMYQFEEKSVAMNFAKLAAERLKLDLLDATNHADRVWIERPFNAES